MHRSIFSDWIKDVGYLIGYRMGDLASCPDGDAMMTAVYLAMRKAGIRPRLDGLVRMIV